MIYRVLFGLSLFGPIAAAQPAQAAVDMPPFQLTDVKNIVDLGEAQISPDGKWVALVVTTPNWKTDVADQEIDLVDTVSGARRAVTWRRKGIASPQWSEDGQRLAFLAEDDSPKADADLDLDALPVDAETDKDAVQKHAQVFVMSMSGGDPIRVTHAKHGVDGFSWSPDGGQIAYITADDPANAKAIKEHNDVFQVTDNHFLTRAALAPAHLWTVPSAGGTAKRLTQGAFSLITDQEYGAPVPAWSRDGRRIAFTRYPGPYWGPSFRARIAVVDFTGGEPRTLAASDGARGAAYAPVGDALASIRARGGDQNNGSAVYLETTAVARDLTAGLARDINRFEWLPGGKTLLAQGADGTHSVLWELSLQGTAKKLDLGAIEADGTFSVAKTGAVAFIGSTPTHPNELYVIDRVGGKPRRLTAVNPWVDGLRIARTESIEWRGPGDYLEDGVLTYPADYQPGTRYPLVLVIHGGPAAASTVRFEPLPQLLAAAGFLVFQPNYRGSTNLGDAYQHAIFRDTGDGPGKDVMAGLAAVEKLGIVDAERIGVSGWSYGGYMTAWLTGHYGRWKAAVAGAALTDWVMDYTVAFYQEGDVYLFGGSPWAPKFRDIWRDQSPIASADKVTAPTLILGDVGDPNVPLINSYEWYHALRDAGVETEFYAYPADTHFPRDIVRTTDVYRRWVGWMSERLK